MSKLQCFDDKEVGITVQSLYNTPYYITDLDLTHSWALLML